MRLPGTRYQEHGWEEVRKLLGQCSLQAFGAGAPGRIDPAVLLAPQTAPDAAAALELYIETVAPLLARAGSRAAGAGNSYGDSVGELALSLLVELQARPADWAALCAAVAGEHARVGEFWHAPGGEARLRKKFNDLYAVLRDKVDSDNYQVACGRPCSPNRIYAYRMLDTAYHEIARLFAGWREHAGQVGAILGRPLQADDVATPIEVRQLRGIADCRPEWVLRWSASLEGHGGAPGPLHTRSKRFAGLKDNPARIAAMLGEIGEYEALSGNRDGDWLQDADDAGAWLEDYWRVLDESERGNTPGPDQILAAGERDAGSDTHDDSPAPDAPDAATVVQLAALARQVSLPPGYLIAAAADEDRASWTARRLAGSSLPVRLAVYLKLLGPFDDSYPLAWLDPASGELPTMQQLAGLDDISLPTLRKRRDAAIALLYATAGHEEEQRWA